MGRVCMVATKKAKPWMQHPPELVHVIRQQGLGDRIAWGKWCYEELEKEREQGGETTSFRVGR